MMHMYLNLFIHALIRQEKISSLVFFVVHSSTIFFITSCSFTRSSLVENLYLQIILFLSIASQNLSHKASFPTAIIGLNGISILITLAPKSASIIVQNGPAKTRVRSKILIPCKAPVIIKLFTLIIYLFPLP